MDDAQLVTPADLPAAPRWKWDATGLTLLLGIPPIAYLGGVAAAGGSVPGFVMVCFAALAIVTFQALRVTRRNQPRVPRSTGLVAVAVAAITTATGWNLLQTAPHTAAITWLWPAVPVALFALLVALIRWGRR